MEYFQDLELYNFEKILIHFGVIFYAQDLSGRDKSTASINRMLNNNHW
jgi:hypothetical protein